MNKITLALALGTGLALSSVALADPIVQQVATPSITASDFSSLFTPATYTSGANTGQTIPVNSSSFQFEGAPNSGTLYSQVFTGTGAAAGLTAYAYQVGVNNVTDANGEPVQVNSTSFHFNATPIKTDVFGGGTDSAAYTISGGTIGGLTLPSDQALTPTSLAWQPGTKTGSLTAQYLDSKSDAGPINAGANSATFVVITKTPDFTTNFANVQSPDPQVGGLTTVYAPTGGTISPIPAPEPTTVLAWAGVLGGIALVRRVRKNRVALAA